jgi:phosphatidylglycerol:prolipoprotein diacylglycerol transferase
MHPVIGHIGGVTIYSHGLMIIVAVIAAGFLMYRLIEKAGLSKTNFVDNISTVILVGVLGARLAYDIIYYYELESFWQAFYLWDGGLVSWGGFILGGLAFIVLLRAQKQPILKWLDLFGLAGIVGVGIGRIGCVLAGDIPGKISKSHPNGFPVAFYEVVACAILAGILFYLYFKKKNLKPGVIFYEAVAGYSLIRLILDGYRDSTAHFLGLNLGQIMAAVVLLVILVFFVFRFLISRRSNG